MNNKVAYKVVRRLEDGTLVSAFADGVDGAWPREERLTYVQGLVTKPSEDNTAGIFCHRTLETAAIDYDTSTSVPCTVEVLEVYPIGEEIIFWCGSRLKRLVNYPAVLVGKKVADVKWW